MSLDSKGLHTVSFKTLGCKLNQSETDAIQSKFLERGFKLREFGEPADLTIINTCTVTGDASHGSRHAIRHAVRSSPSGRIVVTGCYAQISPDEISAIEGVDLILGTDEKYRVFDHLDKIQNGKMAEPLVFVNDQGKFDTVSADGFISATSRTRAFLKVQEGCDYYCSFCIIPFARGRARSRSLQDAVTEAKKLVDQGFLEIVITGINVGTYNDEGKSLVDLLDGLQNVDRLKRIRLSSIEPNTVSDDLLRLVADSSVICPHLHIPLQSAHDDVLKAMNRKYSVDEYARLMDRFQKFLPGAALGTDVIVGFPGETDAHFTSTHAFIENQPFTYLHVFRYSPREGTAAAKLPDAVSPAVVKTRSQILHATSRHLTLQHARAHRGKTYPVLFDHSEVSPYRGYTPNYIRVEVEAKENLTGRIMDVKLCEPKSKLVKAPQVFPAS